MADQADRVPFYPLPRGQFFMRLAGAAIKETCEHFRITPKSLLGRTVIMIVCIIATSLFVGWQAAISQIVMVLAGLGIVSTAALILIPVCLFFASHRIHIEDNEQYRTNASIAQRDHEAFADSANAQVASVTDERDAAVKIVQERPLQLAEAMKYVKWLCVWLRREAQLNPADMTLHKQRSREVVSGLLYEDLTWETTSFAKGEAGNPQDFLSNKAASIQEKLNRLTDGRFNPQWKPPVWLLEFGETLSAA